MHITSSGNQAKPANFCAKRLLRPGPRKLEMSVCPSVRSSVRDLCDFCEEHMDPEHPQIPFAKRALLCGGTKPEKLDTYATSYVQILMITFLIKTLFLPKKYHRLLGVKTFENHQNQWALTVCF